MGKWLPLWFNWVLLLLLILRIMAAQSKWRKIGTGWYSRCVSSGNFLLYAYSDFLSITILNGCYNGSIMRLWHKIVLLRKPGDIFNCSWTKFIAIIVNVCVFFMQNFRLIILTFRVTFTLLTFCVSRDLKFAPNPNFKQLNSIGGNLILKVKWKVRRNWCHFYFKSQ